MFPHPANIILHLFFSERAWPYPYRRMLSHPAKYSAWCFFRKGHGPIPTGGCFPIRQISFCIYFFGKGMALSLQADVFPSGKIFCMVFFPERAWPYPYGRMFPHPANIILHLFFRKGHGPIPTGGCFPIRQISFCIYFFGKGMALSLQADVFPSGKIILHGVFSGKGMALSLRADVFPSGTYHSASIFFGKGMALCIISTTLSIVLKQAWGSPSLA